MTQVVARIVLVPSLVVAVALLVKGGSSVGDGFSAGVVASLGIAIQVLAFGHREARQRLPLEAFPAVTATGLAVMLAVAFVAPAAKGDPLLTHYPPPGEDVATVGTLELTTAFAFDVGIFLAVVGVVMGILSGLAREEGGS